MERLPVTPWIATDSLPRSVTVVPPFDLARTTAPVWWARGRWPNVDWKDGEFFWVGWEAEEVVWRSVSQIDADVLAISGSGNSELDSPWAAAVLGVTSVMPEFDDPVLAALARRHSGMRPWSAGSLYDGVVASIVGQSISVAAAAMTERRLFELFYEGLELGGRRFWPSPLPGQLGASSVERVRTSGVTMRRAAALVTVGALFVGDAVNRVGPVAPSPGIDLERLLAIPGIGPWTVQSALLWGIGDADAHPTGDVALLRAARRHYKSVSSLKDLDRLAEQWKPWRAWAARLLWIDLLGFQPVTRHIP